MYSVAEAVIYTPYFLFDIFCDIFRPVNIPNLLCRNLIQVQEIFMTIIKTEELKLKKIDVRGNNLYSVSEDIISRVQLKLECHYS